MNLPIAAPGVVLDTNVLLDWLVYRDRSCVALGAAIEAGELRWLACPGMREEWDKVLARGVGAERSPDLPTLGRRWAVHAHMLPTPMPHPGSHDCHCTDPDDQVFIDLALSCSARWLLSRDKALLKLAARARRRGLLIVAPAGWSLAEQP